MPAEEMKRVAKREKQRGERKHMNIGISNSLSPEEHRAQLLDCCHGTHGTERQQGLGLTTEQFAATDSNGCEYFFPRAALEFTIGNCGRHYCVPLLLNRYGYICYRGS